MASKTQRKYSTDEIISMIPVLEGMLKVLLGVTDVEIVINTPLSDAED